MAEFQDILGERYDAAVTRTMLSELPAEEPEQIGDRYYLSFNKKGLSLVLLLDMTVEAVQFHAEGHEEFSAYRGPLPFGIHFSTDRAEARARLGTPNRSAEARLVPVLGLQQPWDIFDFTAFVLHLLYASQVDGIQMVTLQKPGATQF